MASHVISSSPGVRQLLLTCAHDPSKIALRTEYDARPTLDHARYLRDRMHAAKRQHPDLRPRAVIPVAEYFAKKMWQWSQKELEAWLRDPAHSMLRLDK